MEADWSVEIGTGVPVIDALWTGLINLADEPHRIDEIEETNQLPALANALLRINSSADEAGSKQQPIESPAPIGYAFASTKCDLWLPEEWDPDEMEAAGANAQTAIACYIDLLLRSRTASSQPPATLLLFGSWTDAEQTARALAIYLRARPLPCSRAEFIVRSAVTPSHEGFAITAYLTACGEDDASARTTLASALEELTRAIEDISCPPFRETPIPLQ